MISQKRKSFNNRQTKPFNKVFGYVWDKMPTTTKRRATPVNNNQTMTRRKRSDITMSEMEGTTPVSVLHLHGPLDADSYLDLVAKAKEVYQAGGRHIVLNMSDVPSVSMSSLVALHSVAVLLRGEEPLSPDGGWHTLKLLVNDMQTAGRQKQFKLLNPRPEVQRSLEQAGIKGFLEIHTSLQTAIASF